MSQGSFNIIIDKRAKSSSLKRQLPPKIEEIPELPPKRPKKAKKKAKPSSKEAKQRAHNKGESNSNLGSTSKLTKNKDPS